MRRRRKKKKQEIVLTKRKLAVLLVLALALIAIPGYKSLSLKAGQTEQSVNLYNPAENDCYFVMTLLLPDGTQIWKSKMVEPGKGLYEITLDQPVEAGTYENSTLKYECYRMDEELTALNGSEIRLTLEVK